MGPMWIVTFVALFLAIVVVVVSVITVVQDERNRRLIAKEEGLDGPGDETREHPEDSEVVVPVADLIRRLQEETAEKTSTEWKQWNKP